MSLSQPTAAAPRHPCAGPLVARVADTQRVPGASANIPSTVEAFLPNLSGISYWRTMPVRVGDYSIGG